MKKVLLCACLAVVAACSPPAHDKEGNGERRQQFERYKTFEQMDRMVVEMHLLVEHWVLQQGESTDKAELKKMLDEDYPALKKKMEALKPAMEKKDQLEVEKLFQAQELYIRKTREIMQVLNSFDNYENPTIMLPYHSAVIDADGELVVEYHMMKRICDELTSEAAAELEEKHERD